MRLKWEVTNTKSDIGIEMPLRVTTFESNDEFNYWGWCKNKGAPPFSVYQNKSKIQFQLELQVLNVKDRKDKLLFPDDAAIKDNTLSDEERKLRQKLEALERENKALKQKLANTG